MGLEEAKKASDELANQEMIAEIQRQLPERLRFGGEFGLPSALGYGKDADSRAQIRGYLTPGLDFPNRMGVFGPRSPRASRLTLEELAKLRRMEDDPAIEFISGEPDYDATTGSKGISVFLPTGRNPQERAYNTAEGFEGSRNRNKRYSYANAIAHELTHKFFDSPAFLDFLEETGRSSGTPLTARQEHHLIESVEPMAEEFERLGTRKHPQQYYSELLDQFRGWLTPEREEKYGVRLPIQSTLPEYPSTLDKLIDFIRGQ
jgi:hypothetical protein